MIDIYNTVNSYMMSHHVLYMVAFAFLVYIAWLAYTIVRAIIKRMYVVLPILDTLKDDNAAKIKILHVTKTKFDDNIYVVFVDGNKDSNIRVLAEHEFLSLKTRNK